MNSTEFIDGLRARDPVAAQHLHKFFVPSIWRFVFFRVDRDSHLTEDIVAESVLALVAAAGAETAIENPAAWLRTVALRRIQDHYRAAARVKHLIDQAQHQSQDNRKDDPAVMHDQELNRQRVRDAMEELPEHYRMALEWKYVDRVGVKEIAARLAATEKGAESILFRARRALRELLQCDRVESPPSERSSNRSDQSSPPEKTPPSLEFRLAREN